MRLPAWKVFLGVGKEEFCQELVDGLGWHVSCNSDSECGTGVSCLETGYCGGIDALCEGNKFCDSSEHEIDFRKKFIVYDVNASWIDDFDTVDFVCISGASPLPPGRKRDLSLQCKNKVSLCPTSQIPCPVFPKGSEVRFSVAWSRTALTSMPS